MSALPSGSVDVVIADPPYNIGVAGSAWDTVPDYLAWSAKWLQQCARILRPGGSLFLYGSPAKLWICRLKLLAADVCGLEFKQHISWVYKQGGDSRLTGMTMYSVRMEHLEWFVKPGGPHTFNATAAAEKYTEAEKVEALAKGVGRVTPESLERGRPPRNWWDIPRENSKSKERAFGIHPSMKPLQICDRIVAVHSNPGDRVVVPFGGSGSECVAAATAGRHVVAYETDSEYFELMLRRLSSKGLIPASPASQVSTMVLAAGDQTGVDPTVADDAPELLRDARHSSGFVGVYKIGTRWVAKVMRGGALRSVGAFSTPQEAATAYFVECSPLHNGRMDERPSARAAMIKLGHQLDAVGVDVLGSTSPSIVEVGTLLTEAPAMVSPAPNSGGSMRESLSLILSEEATTVALEEGSMPASEEGLPP